jgi:NADPH2:quinone reductase
MPTVGPPDVLVQVEAAALNRADLSPKKEEIAGMEWAGVVTQVGAQVPQFRPGDRVMCSGKAGFAEFAATDWGRVMKIPDALGAYEQAACLMMALQTMHDALVTHGQMSRGKTVLVHGASSGVGLMALQIARWGGAAWIIGTSATPARRARLLEYGADVVVDSGQSQWWQEVVDATGGAGADVVIDQVGGPRFPQTMKAAALKGWIVNVDRLAGKITEFDLDLHALQRLSYVGVTFRSRSKEEVRELTRAMAADLAGAVATGALALPIDAVHAPAEAEAAFSRMRANAHFGKIVFSFDAA